MRIFRIILSFAFLIQFSFGQTLEGKVIDRIVAIVNNEVITESELDAALVPIRAQYNQIVNSKREFRRKLKEARILTLNQTIEKKLLLQKAEEENIKLSNAEVKKMFAKIEDRFSTRKKFQEWLDEQKLTGVLLEKRLKEQGLIRNLIDKKLRPGIKVTPEETRIFYEENQGKFTEDAKAKLSYILIKGPPEQENEKAEALIRQVWGKLMEGVDFELLAKEYSDGPKSLAGRDSEFINIQTLSSELRKIVERLKVGEITEIIRTPSGFNIIKLTGKKEARKKDFSEVKDLVEEQIFRKKLEDKYQDWVEKLKQKAYIERK